MIRQCTNSSSRGQGVVMRKVFLPIFIFCFGVLVGLFCRSSLQYHQWVLPDKIDASEIREIDLNCINGLKFNIQRTTRLARTVYGATLPITDTDKIRRIVNCINSAEIIEYTKTEDIGDMLFLKTRKKIYYLRVGWDDEKFYGRNWQSKELYELIKQWRQEKEDLYYQAREN